MQKKAHAACEWHSQLDDSIGNTPTTVSWRVWGYEVGLGWRLASSGISLPNNVFSWLLSDFTGPFSRPKNPSKTCAPQGASPVGLGFNPNPKLGLDQLVGTFGLEGCNFVANRMRWFPNKKHEGSLRSSRRVEGTTSDLECGAPKFDTHQRNMSGFD